MTKSKWKTLSSKTVHKNPWYSIREDAIIRPSGEKGKYYVVVQKQSVFVVAFDDNLNVYLIELFRYTTNLKSIEIPGGGIEKGETPLKGAKRELQEETGITAKKWKEVGFVQLENGTSDAIGHLFIAENLHFGEFDKASEEGINKIIKLHYTEVLKIVKEGKITDSISIGALTRVFLYKGLIKYRYFNNKDEFLI